MTAPSSPGAALAPPALLAEVHPFTSLPVETLEALAGRLRTVALPAGARLRTAWGGGDALAFAVDGTVEWVTSTPGRAMPPARTAGPQRAFLTRGADEEGPSPRIVRCALPGTIAYLPMEQVQTLVAEHPALEVLLDRLTRRDALACMHTVLGTLDDLLLDDLETACDWVTLRRGEPLFEAGTSSDGLYFVIAGRLKAVRPDRDGPGQVLGSIGPGEPAGEVAFLTGGVRNARVVAARASLVVQLTDAEFDALAARRPRLARSVARSVVERAASTGRSTLATATVVLIPASGTLDRALAEELARELKPFGNVLHLDRAAADARLGGGMSAAEGTPEGERADAWLEAAEAANRFLLLEADPTPTDWTLRCLRQADRVLVLADARNHPAPGELETLLAPERGITEGTRHLVLLHPPETTLPVGTRQWLTARPWLAAHHHVRRGEPAPGGISRVARALADRSVGVVLGGGGARGFAHIGILRALTELGVPIDRVAGTSMGASMAAQWALGWSPDRMRQIARRVWIEIRPHKLLDLPIVSFVSNRQGLECAKMMYGDTDIEDLWIPFFCVSSSLTRAKPVVHRKGPLLWACTASASLPGFAPPVLIDGELLVDGALLNNVPADVMHADGVGTLIAAEVSPENESVFVCDYVPTSGWAALRDRWRGRRRFPSIPEVMMRASMLHSVGQEQEICALVDLFLHPQVDGFPMMNFNLLDDIAEAGYQHAMVAVAEWQAKQSAAVTPAALS